MGLVNFLANIFNGYAPHINDVRLCDSRVFPLYNHKENQFVNLKQVESALNKLESERQSFALKLIALKNYNKNIPQYHKSGPSSLALVNNQPYEQVRAIFCMLK